MQTKFVLNDSVCSKKTGLPATGTVVTIFDTIYYNLLVSPQPKDRWDELYPDWKEKPVYTVLFKEPQRTVSIEEIRRAYPEVTNEEYKYKIPMIPSAYYPEDDLELL